MALKYLDGTSNYLMSDFYELVMIKEKEKLIII
jgi:hypothetical protein